MNVYARFAKSAVDKRILTCYNSKYKSCENLYPVVDNYSYKAGFLAFADIFTVYYKNDWQASGGLFVVGFCRKRSIRTIEKDITEKILEDHADVFADIVNVLLFNGEQMVRSEELEETAVYSQYKADDAKIHEQERDIAKYWTKNGTRIAICGIENQTDADRLMPLRVMGYDGAAYRGQALSDAKDIVPVITIVLYFGTGRWNRPRSLKKLLKIPKEMNKYVNDYRIHVYEISLLTDEQVNMFQSDFGAVAKFFVNKRKKNGLELQDTRELKHVDEVLKLLAVMTSDHRYEEILTDGKEKAKNMCEVAQRYIDQGMAAGRIEGEKVGRKAGIKAGRKAGMKAGLIKGEKKGGLKMLRTIVQNMLDMGNTPEQIAAQTGMDINDIRQAINE